MGPCVEEVHRILYGPHVVERPSAWFTLLPASIVSLVVSGQGGAQAETQSVQSKEPQHVKP